MPTPTLKQYVAFHWMILYLYRSKVQACYLGHTFWLCSFSINLKMCKAPFDPCKNPHYFVIKIFPVSNADNKNVLGMSLNKK